MRIAGRNPELIAARYALHLVEHWERRQTVSRERNLPGAASTRLRITECRRSLVDAESVCHVS